MDAMSPNKACDPWAVYSATRTRESGGLKGVDGLTPLQKEIYEYIRDKGRVTGEELMTKFRLTQRELETQFATLRHCELARGQKEGDKVYLVPVPVLRWSSVSPVLTELALREDPWEAIQVQKPM